MTPYYECHITFEADKRRPLVDIVKSIGWKFSCIDGDPSMGMGIRCYATHHFNGGHGIKDVVITMEKTAEHLAANRCKVIRQKVELVVYDTKQFKTQERPQ